TRRLARMDWALGARERNRRRKGDARCRPIAAKSESELPDRIDAPGRARGVNSSPVVLNMSKRIGVVTGGGDWPGLNAVIRAVAKTSANRGWECIGIVGGYEGLLEPYRTKS